MFENFSPKNAIIEPVRDALAYYTEMQRALEEEKAKKDSMVESGEGDKNGLLHMKSGTNNNNGGGGGSSGDDKPPGNNLLLSKVNSLTLRRSSTTRLTAKHSVEVDASSS